MISEKYKSKSKKRNDIKGIGKNNKAGKSKFIIAGVFLVILVILLVGGKWYFNKYDTSDYEHIGFFPTTKLKPIWERKIKTSQKIKIGFITDTHVHPKRIHRENRADDAPRYLPEKLMAPLIEFQDDMKKFQPDFVAHLGDVIEGTNEKDFVGVAGIKLVSDELEKIGVPVWFVLGNHDVRAVTKQQFKEALEINSLNKMIDVGDYRFIILDGDFKPTEEDTFPKHGYTQGYLPDKVLQWLEPKLQTNKQVVILMHFAAWPPQLIGTSGIVGNAEKLRAMMNKYNVLAIFNGHIEKKKYANIDGTQFFSFTGTKKSEKYKNCFYEVTFQGNDIKATMYYVDPQTGEHKVVDFKQ